jgi:hypothetical protein
MSHYNKQIRIYQEATLESKRMTLATLESVYQHSFPQLTRMLLKNIPWPVFDNNGRACIYMNNIYITHALHWFILYWINSLTTKMCTASSQLTRTNDNRNAWPTISTFLSYDSKMNKNREFIKYPALLWIL